jgi:hypothetical protein
MSIKHSARSLALMNSDVQNPAPMVEITFPITADMLERIEALREACKPVETTRETMLRAMVQTGIVFWESQTKLQSPHGVKK